MQTYLLDHFTITLSLIIPYIISSFNISLHYLLWCVWECVSAHAPLSHGCHSTHEVRRQFAGFRSPTTWVQGWYSGGQAWQQVPIPTEPSNKPSPCLLFAINAQHVGYKNICGAFSHSAFHIIIFNFEFSKYVTLP